MLVFKELVKTDYSVKGVPVWVERARNHEFEDSTGGFCSTAIQLETPVVEKMFSFLGTPAAKPEVCIIVSRYIASYLSEDELEFVIGHETGHVLGGHITDEPGLLNDLDKEIEADRKSVMLGSSAKAGISTLWKLYHKAKYTLSLGARVTLWLNIYTRCNYLQRLVRKGL